MLMVLRPWAIASTVLGKLKYAFCTVLLIAVEGGGGRGSSR